MDGYQAFCKRKAMEFAERRAVDEERQSTLRRSAPNDLMYKTHTNDSPARAQNTATMDAAATTMERMMRLSHRKDAQ